jgi:hypothetical protein
MFAPCVTAPQLVEGCCTEGCWAPTETAFEPPREPIGVQLDLCGRRRDPRTLHEVVADLVREKHGPHRIRWGTDTRSERGQCGFAETDRVLRKPPGKYVVAA